MGLTLVDDTELVNGCRVMTCAFNWFELESGDMGEDGYVDLSSLGGVTI